MKKAAKKKPDNRVDEYSAPTEPLPVVPAMLPQPPDQNSSIPRGRAVKNAFQPYPDTRQPLPVYPYIQAPYADVGRYTHYPFSPDAASRTQYGEWPKSTAWNSGDIKTQRTRRRRLLPKCVGLFFLGVQLLLVVRLGILFLSLSPDITWVSVIIDVSAIFVLPFQMLWSQIPSVDALPLPNIEVYTLIAILIYGVLSRLLVGILKGLLKSR